MAKGGGVFSTGPVIASGRGGTSLGVRVGGIEGGRSISPAEARITNIFGPAITSPRQIGFKISAKPGIESVRSLVPLKFPIRGENKARPIQPSVRPVEQSTRRIAPLAEEAKPKPQIIQFPGARAAVAESTRLPKAYVESVEAKPEIRPFPGRVEQVFSRSLRNNLATLTGVRAQTGIAVGVETSTAAKTQVQPQALPALETFVKTAGNTAIRTKPETGTGVPNRIRNKNGYADRSENGQSEKRRRGYVAVDEDTNARRLVSLKEGLRKLQTTALGEDIRGKDLVNTVKISAKRFRSYLLWQLGLENRIDGSAHQLGEDLSQEQNITVEKLEGAIRRNNAVEKADNPAGVTATYQETQKVLTPPRSAPNMVPAVLIADQVEVIDTSREATMQDPESVERKVVVNQKITEPQLIEGATGSSEVLDSVYPLLGLRRLLDIPAISNSIEAKRRQLILAA